MTKVQEAEVGFLRPRGRAPDGRGNIRISFDFPPSGDQPWVSSAVFLSQVREEKQSQYTSGLARDLMSLVGEPTERSENIPQMEFDADKFAAHLLMTASPSPQSTTGAGIFDRIMAEQTTPDTTQQQQEARTLTLVANMLGLPEYVVRMWFATRDDDIRAANGMTPAEWLLSSEQ